MAQLSVEGVNVDQYKFRVRDLEFVNAQSSLEGDSRIISGAVVVIHKHRPVNGDTNWTSGMDRYVDRFAVVSDAKSRDGAGCRIAHLVLEGETLSYAFRVRDLELVGSGPVESLGGDDNIKVGSSVIISKHRPVDGRENWASEMDRYVGCRAVVKEFTGTDSSRCKMARLTVDGTLISRFSFRVRDLTLISSAPQTSDPLSGSGEIRVGSRVVIHRHRPVGGRDNWSSEMNQYIGRTAVVSSFTGKDSSGCAMARLSIDGEVISRFTFRKRDLTLCGGPSGNTLDGDPRIVVGSHVVIHKHRAVNGKMNWASGMDKYVDFVAKVEGFTGKDSQNCRMARLSVDSETISTYTFRVRDLELVSDSSSYETLNGDSRIAVGSEVIIHKHRPVKGNANWTSEMDKYVGMQATVSRFTGTDSADCKMASLVVDGEPVKYVFRVRDLSLLQ